MRATRSLALLGALMLVGTHVPGCGQAEVHYRQRTAQAWAADVWSPSAEASIRATKALREFSITHPTLVTEALAAELKRPRPPPTATPFSIRLDLAQATRLGLGPLAAPEALEVDLTSLRRRMEANGALRGSLHGDAKGDVDVILEGARSRAEAERIQRYLCRRGALELRAVLEPPTDAEPGTGEYAGWFNAERMRFDESATRGIAYVPSRPDRRIAPVEARITTYVALEEPANPSDAFDERMVASARGFVGPDKRGRVRVSVLPDRQADFARWTATLVGRELAVLRDGVVVERRRLGAGYRDRFELAATGELGEPPDEARRAVEDAATIVGGRIPRPLMPIPLPDGFGADPLPRNPLSQQLLELGAISVPALERVKGDSTAPRWSRDSAEWALAEIAKFLAAERPSDR